jgi:MYXO-CTERM domain-containing protein
MRPAPASGMDLAPLHANAAASASGGANAAVFGGLLALLALGGLGLWLYVRRRFPDPAVGP